MQISALHAICISNRYMFGIGDDYNVEKTAKKIFGAKKFFHTPYSKNTNTLFKRKMSKTFTTLDSHTGRQPATQLQLPMNCRREPSRMPWSIFWYDYCVTFDNEWSE